MTPIQEVLLQLLKDMRADALSVMRLYAHFIRSAKSIPDASLYLCELTDELLRLARHYQVLATIHEDVERCRGRKE